MASTPDLANDKEPFGQPSNPRGFEQQQYPSSHFLASEYTSRTREKYLEASGKRGAMGYESQQKGRSCLPSDPKKRKWMLWGIPIAIILIAGVAVGVAVGVSQSKKTTTGSGSSSGAGTGGTSNGGGGTGGGTGTGESPAADDTASNPFLTTASGNSGSTVTTDLGAQFTYQNDFGGSWSQSAEDPYSVSPEFHARSSEPANSTSRYPDRLKSLHPSLQRSGLGARIMYEGECRMLDRRPRTETDTSQCQSRWMAGD